MSESVRVPRTAANHGSRSPYVGPRPFRSSEQFKGRGREASGLVNTLLAGRIVMLHSPSGAGKTSLIQASIVPAFEERDFRICSTSAREFSAIRVNLPPPDDLTIPNRYVFSVVNGMVGHLVDESEALQMRIPDAFAVFETSCSGSGRVLLVIDQLEEVLTLDPCDLEVKAEFFRQLGEALDHDLRWCLLSMREDYVGGLDRFRRYLPGQLRSTFRLELLEESAAAAAIKEPAAAAHVTITDEAVSLIVDKLRHARADPSQAPVTSVASPYVEPVLLQVVCDGLWRKLSAVQGRDFQTITADDVTSFGSFNTALSHYYQQVVHEAAQGDRGTERKIRSWIDQRLISRAGLRRPTLSTPEVDDPMAVLRALQDRYLIRDDPRPGGTWWELAHDLLVKPVQQDNRLWRKGHLAAWQVMADNWYRFDRDRRFLLGPTDLRTATHLSRKSEVTEVERRFLAASREAVAARGRLAKLQQLNTVYGAALLLSLLVNLLLLVLWLY